MSLFQSTRPIRGATSAPGISGDFLHISIHAPHTGRDYGINGGLVEDTISIHAPHTGRDKQRGCFLTRMSYFNPRAPYGARLAQRLQLADKLPISIHAPHTGRDTDFTPYTCRGFVFQSTRPIRGATQNSRRQSVHFLYFNPRAPYGARLANPARVIPRRLISIHAPHTGRDPLWCHTSRELAISIHAPHTGRDRDDFIHLPPFHHFNPRAPYGARPIPPYAAKAAKRISIHAPHTGRDGISVFSGKRFHLFQSTRPIRGATISKSVKGIYELLFQSTRPIRGATLGIFGYPASLPNFNPRAPYGARRQ